MYYYGYFRGLNTENDPQGQLFKVVILTDFNNFNSQNIVVGGELLFGDSPFVVQYAGEEDNLFKAYKCSSATVQLLQQNYNLAFNETRGNNVFVCLFSKNYDVIEQGNNYVNIVNGDTMAKSNNVLAVDSFCYNVEWVGYATPNAYSQSYESYLDVFELECQDALSTLQYWNYETIGEEKTFVPFSEILKRYLKLLKVYKNVYISKAISMPSEDTQTDILHSILVDEHNFFDEDGNPMKQQEVLEHICTFLGLTCVPYKDSLYFVNYDAIKEGYNQYFKIQHAPIYYPFITSPFPDFPFNGEAEFVDVQELLESDFKAGGTTLSLGTTFNKATVKDSLYTFDSVINDYEEETNQLPALMYDTVGLTKYEDEITQSDSDITIMKVTVDDKKYYVFLKYCGFNPSKGITNTFYYNDIAKGEWGAVDNTIYEDGNWTFDTSSNKVGCCLVKYQVSPVDSWDETINSVELENAIMFRSGHLYTDVRQLLENKALQTQPMFSVTSEKVAIGSDNYIVISGNFKFSRLVKPLPIGVTDNDQPMNSHMAYTWAKLQCGSLFWNGEQWTTQEDIFKLPLEYKKSVSAWETSIPIINNIDYTMRLNKKGYAVKCPQSNDEVEIKDITFTLYRPWGVHDGMAAFQTWLTDFNMDIATRQDYIISVGENEDTEYSNNVGNGAVEEYEGKEFKICTWDNKQTNYSSPIYLESYQENPNIDETQFRRVGAIYNKATESLKRSEHLYLDGVVSQYSTPTVRLETAVKLSNDYKPYSLIHYHFFEGKDFIIDSATLDYLYNTITLNLLEKKETTSNDIIKGDRKRNYYRNGDIANDEGVVKYNGESISYDYTFDTVVYDVEENDGNIYLIET